MDWQNEEAANANASAPTAKGDADIRSYVIKEPVGYALLLGCETHTSQEHPSPSVREDINSMENTLKKLDWKVYSPCVDGTRTIDLTVDSCEQIINNLESPELNECSCFMLYYSGYGVASGVVGSSGRVVTYKDIVTKLSGLATIEGKPKIFIFDCCRNKAQKEMENLQNQFGKMNLSYNEELEDRLRQDRSTNDYPPPDCVLCFSACEGSTGHMTYKMNGSYFTRKLCHTLLHFGQRLPFTEIMTQVYGGTVGVSMNVFGVGQQPVLCSTLNRSLVLSRKLCKIYYSSLWVTCDISPVSVQIH